VRYRKFLIIFIALSLLFSIVGESKAHDVVSAKIEPETIKIGQKGQIKVTFTIPAGLHQSLEEDYFFIRPAKLEGFIFEPTMYPEGEKDKDEVINYHNTVTLTREFIVSKEAGPGSYEIKVIAGYQLCDNTGLCLFPEEVELVLPITIGDVVKPEKVAKIKDSVLIKSSIIEQDFANIKKLLDDFNIAGVLAGYQKSHEFISFL